MSIDETRSRARRADRPGSLPAPPGGLDRAEIGTTPIFTHVWPDSAELDAELRRLVLARMATTPGLKKSNCGGWQSERDLQLWGGAAIETLLTQMRAMLRTVIAETVPGAGEDLLDGWDIEAWANVNQLDDTVAAHDHSGGVNMWAAIYYVDTGEGSGPATSGFTRYVDMSGTPRPVTGGAPAPVAAVRAGASRQENCTGPLHTGDYDLQLEPAAGKMVVFPATLPHYVTAYTGTGKRITIALNLRHTRFVVADYETPYSRRRMMWRNYRGAMLVMYRLKRLIRTGVASVLPVDRWPAGLRDKLLGG